MPLKALVPFVPSELVRPSQFVLLRTGSYREVKGDQTPPLARAADLTPSRRLRTLVKAGPRIARDLAFSICGNELAQTFHAEPGEGAW